MLNNSLENRDRSKCFHKLTENKADVKNDFMFREEIVNEYEKSLVISLEDPGLFYNWSGIEDVFDFLLEIGVDREVLVKKTVDQCKLYKCDGILFHIFKEKTISKTISDSLISSAVSILSDEKNEVNESRPLNNIDMLLDYSIKAFPKHFVVEEVNDAWGRLHEASVNGESIKDILILDGAGKLDIQSPINTDVIDSYISVVLKHKDPGVAINIIPYIFNVASRQRYNRHGERLPLSNSLTGYLYSLNDSSLLFRKYASELLTHSDDPGLVDVLLSRLDFSNEKNNDLIGSTLQRFNYGFDDGRVNMPTEESLLRVRELTKNESELIRSRAWNFIENSGGEYPLSEKLNNRYDDLDGKIELVRNLYFAIFLSALVFLLLGTIKSKQITKVVPNTLMFVLFNFVFGVLMIFTASVASIGHNTPNTQGFLSVLSLGLVPYLFAVVAVLISHHKKLEKNEGN